MNSTYIRRVDARLSFRQRIYEHPKSLKASKTTQQAVKPIRSSEHEGSPALQCFIQRMCPNGAVSTQRQGGFPMSTLQLSWTRVLQSTSSPDVAWVGGVA